MKTLHKRCAGLDVHKKKVVACLRLVVRGKANYEVGRFLTTTRGLLELAEWLEQAGCTHVAMEATASTGSRSGTCLKGASNRSWPTRRISRVYPAQERHERCDLDR